MPNCQNLAPKSLNNPLPLTHHPFSWNCEHYGIRVPTKRIIGFGEGDIIPTHHPSLHLTIGAGRVVRTELRWPQAEQEVVSAVLSAL